ACSTASAGQAVSDASGRLRCPAETVARPFGGWTTLETCFRSASRRDVAVVPLPQFEKHRREIERRFVDSPLPLLDRQAEDFGDLARIGNRLGVGGAAVKHGVLPRRQRTGREFGQLLQIGCQSQFLL